MQMQLQARPAAMEEVELDRRPRPISGRRPRVNGGRRRPRGWMGDFKVLPVVSRASYPPAAPKLNLPNPTTDDFPGHVFDEPQPTGVPEIDAEVRRITTLLNLLAKTRLVLIARADVLTTSSAYRKKTKAIWGEHDRLLAMVENLCQKCQDDFGYQAPIVPVNFYSKF
ncbi:hypothetical protein ZWY2020_027537 [Hordeum vulgare]|nr:hypothetical protein ZWY2020_027537 [Hordeum vulgare]